jgi:tetratricopeptide (TPR) repeat protein
MSYNKAAEIPPNCVRAPVETLSKLHIACTMGEEATEAALMMFRGWAGDDDELFTSMVNMKTTDNSYTGGYTPLHYACQNGSTGVARLLLEAGADPNIAKNNGATPIMSCLINAGWTGEMEPYKSCIMFLLNHPRFVLKLNDNSATKSSPIFCCVCQEHKSEDVLLPLLELFLARGFDASATIHNQSSLHMALWRGHEKSAFALVRAGADIYQTAPKSLVPEEGDKEVWNAIDCCREIYGDQMARRLEQAANASAAVAGPRTRRKILRASAGDTSKMAKKAVKAAETLIAAGRWEEAKCAYIEAIEYPADALDDRDRSIAFNNLSSCLVHTTRTEEAVRYARQFYQEFPDNPSSLFALATAIWHQQAISGEHTDEMAECAEKAERLLSHARGNEYWLIDNGLEFMNTRLQQLKKSVVGLQATTPALKAAQTAINEFNKDDGDIVKAAHAIDEALKPELEHPNPTPMRALRGSIYFQWGKDILETPDNSVVSGDDAGLPDLAGVSLQDRVLLAKEKFETALAEFEYSADSAGDNLALPRTIYDWNSGLALIVLNRFDEGCARCLENLRKRLEEQLVNADISQRTETRAMSAVIHGSSTNDLLFQLVTAFKCASLLEEQQAKISIEDDSPHKATSDAAREAFAKLRADGAAVIVESVLSAQRRLSSPSSRVMGTMLKEVHYWDPNVTVPEELSKAQSKVPAPLRCGECGKYNPSNRCPCGKAHYCSKACQIKAWKEHKSDCAFHKQRKDKK